MKGLLDEIHSHHVFETKREHEVEKQRKLKIASNHVFPRSCDLAEITSASWKHASCISSSHGGSGGVFFVDFPSAVEETRAAANESTKKLVVKGSGEPAREVFATRVLRLLGLCSPDVRVVSFSMLEWAEVKLAVQRLCVGELRFRCEKSLNRPQLLLFEFVEGTSLLEIPPTQGSCWENAEFLEQLGEICAVDVVLNNLDRLPLSIWDNDGNLGNVLVEKDTGKAVAIDTAIYAVKETINGKPNPMLERLRARQRQLSIKGLCARLADQGITVGDENALQRGLERGIRKAKEVLTPDVLKRERDIVAHMCSEDSDWQGVWEKDIALIDLNFINKTLETLEM